MNTFSGISSAQDRVTKIVDEQMKNQQTVHCINLKCYPIGQNEYTPFHASQLPNGVLIFNKDGGTTFIPNIKIVEAPNGSAYFDKISK